MAEYDIADLSPKEQARHHAAKQAAALMDTDGEDYPLAREVVLYPAKTLKHVSVPIAKFDESLKELADAMLDTMFKEGGIGLAAPQIGENKRIIVVDISGAEDEEAPDEQCERILVNPRILESSGSEKAKEGCLSIPGVSAYVDRATTIKVQAQDLDGNEVEFETSGLEARAIQHEIDHLDGKLFIDYIQGVDRVLIEQPLSLLKRRYARKNKKQSGGKKKKLKKH